MLLQLGPRGTAASPPALRHLPRAPGGRAERYAVWARVQSADGGRHCGDVVATAALPGDRLALVVVDYIGGGRGRAPRADAIARQLRIMLSVGIAPENAVRHAEADLRRAGWEDGLPPLATIFAGIADGFSETLTYVSAAHETALVLGPDGTHRHLASTGPVAGVFESPLFAQAEIPFGRHESLVVVTDGISDSHPHGGPFFGSTGTVRSATQALRRGDDPADALVADALHFGGNANDAAALVVGWS